MVWPHQHQLHLLPVSFTACYSLSNFSLFSTTFRSIAKMKTNDVVFVESTSLDRSPSVEKGQLGPVIGLDERIPLPAELAHLTRDEQDALEKRLVRKIDTRLMPIVILMF
jgi:hypothetical protein